MMKRKFLPLLIIPLILGVSATTLNNDKYFEIIKNIEIFSNVYKELNTYFVDDIDPSQLMKTGIDAMVNSLDPYTNYISESQIENYRLNSEGKYNGIGALSKEIDGKITITEIYEGGSAAESGLMVGDIITKVNGQSTAGRSNDEIIQIMRGAQGAKLDLAVKRLGQSAEQVISMERTNVNVANVPYSGMVGDHIGYVILTTFTQQAGKNVHKAVKELKKEDPELKGVILDLRGNGGGLLFEALNVCNVFIPSGKEIVFTRGKVKERDQTYKTSSPPLDLEIPLAVLINKTSASASEIVSGVIQDLDRGVIIGQRSYGKGLVQNTKELGYNARLKLTTSKYYIPSGRCIQSVEYKDGEPVDIADEKRAKFYTANKRLVLDGGGVTPDVKYDLGEEAEILKALKDDNHIFKYVNDYMMKNPEIAEPGTFSYTDADYNAFKSYLTKNKFEFKTKAEKAIEELKEEKIASKTSSEVASIENAIQTGKADDLQEYKTEIMRVIEEEIIKRKYYQKGKAIQGLSTDPEIKEAISVLNDQNRYKSILKG